MPRHLTDNVWDGQEADDEADTELFEEGDEDEDGSPSWGSAIIDDEDEYPEEEEDEDNPDPYRRFEREDDELVEEREHEEEEDALWAARLAEEPDDLPFATPAAVQRATAGKIPSDRIELYYDDVGYYGYLLLRRREGALAATERERIASHLQAGGLRVVHSGQSYKPASDGQQYQWYLRVQTADGAKPPAAVVEPLLAALGAARRIPPSVSARTERPQSVPPSPKVQIREADELRERVASLERERESLADRLRGAREEISAAAVRERRMAHEVEEREAQYRARLRQLTLRAAAARQDAESEEERVAATQARLEALRGEVEALTAQVERENATTREERARREEAERREREFAAAFDPELAQERERNRGLVEESADLRNQVDVLAYEIEQVREQNRALSEQIAGYKDVRARNGARVDCLDILDALLPNVDLLNGSLDVMFVELEDPSAVLALLRSVAMVGKCFKQKPIKGARPWWEAHYNTGQSDDGRFYFAQTRDKARWKVLVSRKTSKEEQERDIARLRHVEL